jgi:hypothetical protein
MKNIWDIEELIEHFTLVSADTDLLDKKMRAAQLGFALLLKCFQIEARFPAGKAKIPRDVIDYIAHRFHLPISLCSYYDWTGYTITNHRIQIRDHFSFHDTTSANGKETTVWLIPTGQATLPRMEQLKETAYTHFRALHLVFPTLKRIVHSACHNYEHLFFTTAFDQLSPLIYRHINPYGEFCLEMSERIHIEQEEIGA